MPDATWKQVERRICKKLGGTRTPLSGSNSRITAGDCIHEKYFVEIKMRSKIPFYSEFNKTAKLGKQEKRVPMMVIHEKGKPSSIVMIRLNDFIKLLNKSQSPKQHALR